jgi:hypothetical protein
MTLPPVAKVPTFKPIPALAMIKRFEAEGEL